MTQPLSPTPATSPQITSQATQALPAKGLDVLDVATVGARLEIQLTRELSGNMAEIRLRSLDSQGPWSNPIRAQLVTANPATALPAAGSAHNTNRLLAEVVGIKPDLVLKLEPASVDSNKPIGNTPNPGSREWLNSQFCRHLPLARPLASTLQTWLETSSVRPASPQGTSSIAATDSNLLKPLLNPILDNLPGIQDLTDPNRLDQALKRSGIWFEVNLAQTTLDPGFSSNVNHDLKAQLLLAAARLRLLGAAANKPQTRPPIRPEQETKISSPPVTSTQKTPSGNTLAEGKPALAAERAPDLAEGARYNSANLETKILRAFARDIDGMIKQVVTQQLQTLDSDPDQPRWVLELPFHSEHGVMAIRADIRRSRSARHQEEPSWDMRLRLDLQKLGPLSIQLRFRADRLSASLSSASPEGAEIIQQHLSELRRKLEERQVEVANLNAGYRPNCEEEPLRDGDSPMVSEHA